MTLWKRDKTWWTDVAVNRHRHREPPRDEIEGGSHQFLVFNSSQIFGCHSPAVRALGFDVLGGCHIFFSTGPFPGSTSPPQFGFFEGLSHRQSRS